MLKKMLINASQPEEFRVAVVCDGIMEELDVQVNTREATLGNIYKGVVSRIEPSLQAMFVDYGAPKNGFLSINDVHPSYFPDSFVESRRRPRIQEVFKKDDHVLVQVNKEERSTKGASLTTNISVAGRYLVLMPGTDLYGVSRKIEDEIERKKLKEIVKQLKLPENMGFIIRTAGMGRTKTELSRDLDYLLKLWESIEKNVASQEAPALLYREHDVVIRSIREHFSLDISEIMVDEKEVCRRVKDFFHQVMPKYENLVRLYQEKRPLFNKYQLEEQIEQVYRNRIKLKCGGYILIEPTEALVTIDVNSGSAIKEKGVEETAFKVNMEAATEIARQLRLRDLGGIIVIDFIDMSQKKHKQEVEKAVKSVLKNDRAKTKILRISALGLLELSRQRLKSSLGTGEYLECPLCQGHGRVRSPEMTALSVFRKIKSLLVKSDVSEVRATIPMKVGECLLNNMRTQLVEMEKQYAAKVSVVVKHGLMDRDITVESVKEEMLEHLVVESTPQQLAQETIVQAEEELLAESEIKKAKKPARRRRKPRKKVETELEAAERESETDALDDSEETLETESLEAASEIPFESILGTENLLHEEEEEAALAEAPGGEELVLLQESAVPAESAPESEPVENPVTEAAVFIASEETPEILQESIAMTLESVHEEPGVVSSDASNRIEYAEAPLAVAHEISVAENPDSVLKTENDDQPIEKDLEIHDIVESQLASEPLFSDNEVALQISNMADSEGRKNENIAELEEASSETNDTVNKDKEKEKGKVTSTRKSLLQDYLPYS